VAPNPDGHVSTAPPFNFTRLGVRVPAVAISPWIEAGTVINGPSSALFASASSADGSSADAAASVDGNYASVEENESKTRTGLSSAYEHSSVARTLHSLFAPNAAPLTAREAFAAPFHSALLPPASGSPRTAPRTDCPWSLPVSEV
jgi:phospholipase C